MFLVWKRPYHTTTTRPIIFAGCEKKMWKPARPGLVLVLVLVPSTVSNTSKKQATTTATKQKWCARGGWLVVVTTTQREEEAE